MKLQQVTQYRLRDVNGDGRLDLVLGFKTKKTGLSCNDTSMFLSGQTVQGRAKAEFLQRILRRRRMELQRRSGNEHFCEKEDCGYSKGKMGEMAASLVVTQHFNSTTVSELLSG